MLISLPHIFSIQQTHRNGYKNCPVCRTRFTKIINLYFSLNGNTVVGDNPQADAVSVDDDGLEEAILRLQKELQEKSRELWECREALNRAQRDLSGLKEILTQTQLQRDDLSHQITKMNHQYHFDISSQARKEANLLEKNARLETELKKMREEFYAFQNLKIAQDTRDLLNKLDAEEQSAHFQSLLQQNISQTELVKRCQAAILASQSLQSQNDSLNAELRSIKIRYEKLQRKLNRPEVRETPTPIDSINNTDKDEMIDVKQPTSSLNPVITPVYFDNENSNQSFENPFSIGTSATTNRTIPKLVVPTNRLPSTKTSRVPNGTGSTSKVIQTRHGPQFL